MDLFYLRILSKKLMVEKVQVGGASAEHVEHWKVPEIIVCLEVQGCHLQEVIQHQQQKRHPAAIERGYP